MWRLFIFLLWAGNDSCSVKNTAETERKNAYENCMLGKDITLSEDENRRICNCWSEKIAALKVSSNKTEAGVNMRSYHSYLQDCKTELFKK
jgi:hypothetical protein